MKVHMVENPRTGARFVSTPILQERIKRDRDLVDLGMVEVEQLRDPAAVRAKKKPLAVTRAENRRRERESARAAAREQREESGEESEEEPEGAFDVETATKKQLTAFAKEAFGKSLDQTQRVDDLRAEVRALMEA